MFQMSLKTLIGKIIHRKLRFNILILTFENIPILILKNSIYSVIGFIIASAVGVERFPCNNKCCSQCVSFEEQKST